MFQRFARQRLSCVFSSNIRTACLAGIAPAREPWRCAAAEALNL
jgi:hypothetical protein